MKKLLKFLGLLTEEKELKKTEKTELIVSGSGNLELKEAPTSAPDDNVKPAKENKELAEDLFSRFLTQQ